jgi:hypothetical protein
MTLGVNPSTTNGLPVELAWEEHSSEILDIDNFEENNNHELHRISAVSRQKIAEKHHSRNSITRTEKEVAKIQRSIAKSENDKDKDGDNHDWRSFCCCLRKKR